MKEPDATLRLAQALILILRLSIYAPLLHCSIAHVFSPLALLQYTYLSLGCSKAQEQRMLNFARAQVGKPFSNVGMARSIIFPRTSNLSSFYCAGVFLLSNSQTLKLSNSPSQVKPLERRQLTSSCFPFLSMRRTCRVHTQAGRAAEQRHKRRSCDAVFFI